MNAMSNPVRDAFAFYEQALLVCTGNCTWFYRCVEQILCAFKNMNIAVHIIKYTWIIITVKCYTEKKSVLYFLEAYGQCRLDVFSFLGAYI